MKIYLGPKQSFSYDLDVKNEVIFAGNMADNIKVRIGLSDGSGWYLTTLKELRRLMAAGNYPVRNDTRSVVTR